MSDLQKSVKNPYPDLDPIDHERVQAVLVKDILDTMYPAASDELRRKIDAKFPADRYDYQAPVGTLLVAGPGQGMMSSFRQAALVVSSALGMRFLEGQNISDAIRVGLGENDFVFVPVVNRDAPATAVANVMTTTPPSYSWLDFSNKDIDSEQAHLENQLSALAQAGGSVILFDGISLSEKNTVDAAQQMILDKRFAGVDLPGTYIGATSVVFKNLAEPMNNDALRVLSLKMKVFALDTDCAMVASVPLADWRHQKADTTSGDQKPKLN